MVKWKAVWKGVEWDYDWEELQEKKNCYAWQGLMAEGGRRGNMEGLAGESGRG